MAHSIATSRAIIDQECAESLEGNKLTIELTSDLYATFDTVNVNILLKKLKYYGLDEGSWHQST